MENINDEQDILNPDGEATTETEANAEVVENEELAKAKELAQNYKIRAEKAEAAAKSLKAQQPKETETPKKEEVKDSYSLQDIRALSDVHDDDVQEVVDFAKFKGISIPEANKNPTVQVILKTKTEERKTAQATNVGGGGKKTSKSTGESLLEQALNSNEVPIDLEDIDKLAAARIASKEKRA
jgi:hypothetical protein